ncbi:MAG TPA: radical SAM protein [Pseudolabrys sp.]|nr:radical SAM protein [Pseudolabrys sp.]
MYRGALFDITGGCNAQCPLCVTARETFGQRLQFIAVPQFARALDRLLELDLLVPDTGIGLQNWGEPILHPDLDGIFGALSERGLNCGLSTNASKATRLTVSTAHLNEIVFSVPGWSQASYDKVHRLRFERVVENMEATIANLKDTGFAGIVSLNFHVYQFNIYGEVEAAQAWCQTNGVTFRPYLAYINDYERASAYLKDELPPAVLKEISQSILTHYVDELVKSQPDDWQCPQWRSLVLDHRCNVLLCCSLPYSHSECVIGSVFDLTRQEIIDGKRSAKECDDCMSCGVAYWGHNVSNINVPPPPAVVPLTDPTPAVDPTPIVAPASMRASIRASLARLLKA